PKGAICSTLISSPGTHPISINFRKSSFFSKEWILATVPGSNSDNLFILSLLWVDKIMTIPTIQFNFLEPIDLRDRNRLKKFLISLFKKEGKVLGELYYIFCSDSYLLEINRQFLSHDYYTDIITFDLSERSQPINAEIYIS